MFDLLECYTKMSFLKKLSLEEMKRIAPFFRKRTYEKGEIIFIEGEEGDELFLIQKGLVKIYRAGEVRETILEIFREGDYFGEMSLLDNVQFRSASAETLSKTTLFSLKKADFIAMLESNHSITISLLKTVMERLRNANELIAGLTIMDARIRIAKIMLGLLHKHGRVDDGQHVIDLRLTHQQIADLTGLTRVTVTKILLELQSNAIILVENKKIYILDKEMLEAIANK